MLFMNDSLRTDAEYLIVQPEEETSGWPILYYCSALGSIGLTIFSYSAAKNYFSQPLSGSLEIAMPLSTAAFCAICFACVCVCRYQKRRSAPALSSDQVAPTLSSSHRKTPSSNPLVKKIVDRIHEIEEKLLIYIVEGSKWLVTQDRVNTQLNQKTHSLYPSLTPSPEPTRSDRFDTVRNLIAKAVSASESYHCIKASPHPDLEQLEEIEGSLTNISIALSQAHTDTLITIEREEQRVMQAHANISRGNSL